MLLFRSYISYLNQPLENQVPQEVVANFNALRSRKAEMSLAHLKSALAVLVHVDACVAVNYSRNSSTHATNNASLEPSRILTHSAFAVLRVTHY